MNKKVRKEAYFTPSFNKYWGLVAVWSIFLGAAICFSIKPEYFAVDHAFSLFGSEKRTYFYFTASLLLAGYSLWRWRGYFRDTIKHAGAIDDLLSFSALGFFISAVVPLELNIWVSRLHIFGASLVGVCLALAVLIDSIQTHGYQRFAWTSLKLLSCALIVAGGYFALLSSRLFNRLDVIQLGEGLMFLGFTGWVAAKTIPETPLAKLTWRGASKILTQTKRR